MTSVSLILIDLRHQQLFPLHTRHMMQYSHVSASQMT
jgi:hypothetical protein